MMRWPLMISTQLVGNLAIFFLLLCIAEKLFLFFFKKKFSLKETLTDFGIWGGNKILADLFGFSFFSGLILLSGKIAIFQIDRTVISTFLLFLLTDFVYYWRHRLEHNSRIFWAIHCVHHSSTELYFSTSFRSSWLIHFYQGFFYCPLVIIGFHPLQVISVVSLHFLLMVLSHSDYVPKIKILDQILNTPSNHRVHHATEDHYRDKNFSGFFIIWDKVFGTYAVENSKPTYGLPSPIGSNNLLIINFFEFKKLLKDLKNTDSTSEKLKKIFSSP